MILEIATMPVRPGDEEAFAAAMGKAIPLLRRAKGFLGLEFFRCIEEPSSFRLLVRWETLENHTKDFRSSADGQALRDLLLPHYANPPSILHAELIEKA